MKRVDWQNYVKHTYFPYNPHICSVSLTSAVKISGYLFELMEYVKGQAEAYFTLSIMHVLHGMM